MTNIFAPAVYATNWYNGDEETNKVYISDKSSVLIGMPRIRQLRVEKGRDLIQLCVLTLPLSVDTDCFHIKLSLSSLYAGFRVLVSLRYHNS